MEINLNILTDNDGDSVEGRPSLKQLFVRMIDSLNERIPQRFIQIWPVMKSSVLLLILVYFCFGAFHTLNYWYQLILFPGDIDFAESIILFETNLFVAGEDIYPLKDEQRFIGSIYGPVLYLINSLFVFFKSDSYLPVRLASLCGVILSSISFAGIVYSHTKSKLSILYAFALSILPVSVIMYGVTCKPDSLYLGFTLLGFFIALRNLNTRALYYSIPFFVIALYIKPSAIPAPATIFLLLLLRERKKAGYFVLSGFFVSLFFLVIFFSFFGKGFLIHFFTYNVAEFDFLKGLVLRPLDFLLRFRLSLFLALVFYFYMGRPKFVPIYFGLSFIFHIPLMGKAGGFLNYWSEPLLAHFIIIAMGFGKLYFDINKKNLVQQVFLVFCLFLFAYNYNHKSWKSHPTEQSLNNQLALEQKIKELARDTNPIVLASNPGTVVNLRKFVRIIISDPFLYQQHMRLGKTKGELFFKTVREKKAGIIIVNSSEDDILNNYNLKGRFTVEQLQAILKYYKLYSVLPGTQYSEGDFRIYLPR